MVWCIYCAKETSPFLLDYKTCCYICGKVLYEDNFSQEPTFVKNAAGQSQLTGNLVKTIQNARQLDSGRIKHEMSVIVDALGIDGCMTNPALKLYQKAAECNFTRGRRKDQVQAACLYISCRVNHKPHLLIDFSEHLGINVYVLGAVYLQLCKFLNIIEHPVVQNLVDPSLFIHRFTSRLFKGDKPSVSSTAIHIIASMKRDWMQTGRKPSGLCGAALYISALSHGLKCSKSQIIKVVHICEATLTKRLIEFENTEAGGLTVEEFNIKAKEFEDESISTSLRMSKNSSGISNLCLHKDSGSHALCESCYETFIKFVGGLNGGSDPPAFQHAEKERIMVDEATAAADSSENLEKRTKRVKSDEQGNIKNVTEHEVTQQAKFDSTGDAIFEESESLSDIDDFEVDAYLHSEEEKRLKTIIWEEMNKEYLEEQAAKEAAAIAEKKAYEANFSNCSEDVRAAQKLAAAAAAAAAKSKKERQQMRAAERKNSGPPQSAAEATKQMLNRKRLSSKIRYDVLEKLFDEPETPENKKSRTEPESDHGNNYFNNFKEDPELDGAEDTNIDYIEHDYEDDYNHFDDF